MEVLLSFFLPVHSIGKQSRIQQAQAPLAAISCIAVLPVVTSVGQDDTIKLSRRHSLLKKDRLYHGGSYSANCRKTPKYVF